VANFEIVKLKKHFNFEMLSPKISLNIHVFKILNMKCYIQHDKTKKVQSIFWVQFHILIDHEKSIPCVMRVLKKHFFGSFYFFNYHENAFYVF